MKKVNVNLEEIEKSFKKSKAKGFSIKRAASGILAGLMIGGSALGITGCSTKEEPSKYPDYVPGYSSVSDVKDPDDSFVILDVGNHERQTKAEEIKRGNDKDVALGLVISTDADNEAAIYDDVEYVRGLINKYDVNFPVYLNIESIINNKSLNNEMKGKLISDFLGKCTANHIFVGVYGTDETLCLAEKYFDFKDYDAFVVMDSDEIKYSGVCTVFQTADGEIYSKEDLSKTIFTHGLNEASALVNDKKVVVNNSDELFKLSLECGLSYNELLEYNAIKEEDLVAGGSIKIPSRVGARVKSLENADLGDEMIMGCDISSYQNNVDWEKTRENFEFVIIKVSQGNSIDNRFTSHIENANKYDIAAGVYCFNNYSAKNCGDFERFVELEKEQADVAISALGNHKVDFPVYLDVERINSSESGVEWDYILPKKYVVSMINTWSDKVSEAGYIPGIYFNGDCYSYFSRVYDQISNNSNRTADEAKFVENFRKMHKWLAGGEQYTNKNYDISEVREPSAERRQKYDDISVFQVTSTAVNSGAGNGNGHVDVNFSNTNYKTGTAMEEAETVEIKEFDNNSKSSVVGLLPGVGLVGGAAVGAYFYSKHAKKSGKEYFRK